jgi:pimeloyl-ACP methyl ester carboxylesterase
LSLNLAAPETSKQWNPFVASSSSIVDPKVQDAELSCPVELTDWNFPHSAAVKVQSGSLIAGGKLFEYDLYGPEDADTAVMFFHGFALGRQCLAHLAKRAACMGARAMLVERSSLAEGGTFQETWIDWSVPAAQDRVAQEAVGHARWLQSQTKTKRLVLVGHSIGGAIALEVAVHLQSIGQPPSEVLLFDAVPGAHTKDFASQFQSTQTRFVSVRAEPSVWNRLGAFQSAVQQIPKRPGRFFDLKVRNAAHGDALEPMVWLQLSGLLGAGGKAMQRMLDAFLTDAIELNEETLKGVLAELYKKGDIDIDPLVLT